jgi:hypothetical protein
MDLPEIIGVGCLAVLLLLIANRCGLKIGDVAKIIQYVKKEKTK